MFSASELQMILCGDQAPQWSKDDVLNYTEPKLGYTKERYSPTGIHTRPSFRVLGAFVNNYLLLSAVGDI